MDFIAVNLKYLRTKAGLSQGKFATQVGLNRGNVTSYERDVAKPSIDTIQEIVSFFQVDFTDFIFVDLEQKVNASLHNNLPPSQSQSNTIHTTNSHQASASNNYLNDLQWSAFLKNMHKISNNLEKISGDLRELIDLNKKQIKRQQKAEAI